MFALLTKIILDEKGFSLGLTRLSCVSAVADDTGDDSPDACVKIRRLINRRGRSFCAITNFPFLHEEINFEITSANYKYSGTSVLPATFKRVVGGYIVRNGGERHHPLNEINVDTFFAEENPEYLDGIPKKFCVQLITSDYWQIIFDRTPDTTYTVYLTIEKQWTDLTADTSETIITKPFYDFFVHYCDIGRFKQQGDIENYQVYKDEWDNPMKPRNLLQTMLAMLSGRIKHKGVKVDMSMTRPQRISHPGNLRDYGQLPNDNHIGYD